MSKTVFGHKLDPMVSSKVKIKSPGVFWHGEFDFEGPGAPGAQKIMKNDQTPDFWGAPKTIFFIDFWWSAAASF